MVRIYYLKSRRPKKGVGYEPPGRVEARKSEPHYPHALKVEFQSCGLLSTLYVSLLF